MCACFAIFLLSIVLNQMITHMQDCLEYFGSSRLQTLWPA
jgi:hypothetical protein